MRRGSLGSCCGRDLLAGAAPLFYWRGSVALLEVREDDGQYEFLFAVVIPLDHDIFLVAGEHASQAELAVFNLGALCKAGLVAIFPLN